MNHALILNALILALVALTMVLTKSGMALIGLMFLQPLPYGLAQQSAHDGPDDDDSKPIGFTADIQ